MLGIKLQNEWSPRIGFVWDPTQQGRAKIFANYGRYYEDVPLDIADRELSGESQIAAEPPPAIRSPRAHCRVRRGHPRSTNPTAPADRGGWSRRTRPPSIPTSTPAANDEIVAGGEYEVIRQRPGGPDLHLPQPGPDGGGHVRRRWEHLLHRESWRGHRHPFPKAKRTYHAVTASFTKTFADLWLAQISYTWQQLRGNYDGLFRNEDGQLDPNINSTFDLAKLLVNQDGPLRGTLTHTIKLYAAKEFVILPVFSVTLGVGYTGTPGAPINYTGPSNESGYGPGQVYILERGSGRPPPLGAHRSTPAAAQLPGQQGHDRHRRGRGVQPLQLPEAAHGGQRVHLRHTGAATLVRSSAARNGSLPNGYGGVCTANGLGVHLFTTGTGGSLPRGRAEPLRLKLTRTQTRPARCLLRQQSRNWGRPLPVPARPELPVQRSRFTF